MAVPTINPCQTPSVNHSLDSRVSNFGHRSFEWLKKHPFIPVAIIGIATAGYFAANYLVPMIPTEPESFCASSAFQKELSSICKKGELAYGEYQPGDITKIIGRVLSDGKISCETHLTKEAFAKTSLVASRLSGVSCNEISPQVQSCIEPLCLRKIGEKNLPILSLERDLRFPAGTYEFLRLGSWTKTITFGPDGLPVKES